MLNIKHRYQAGDAEAIVNSDFMAAADNTNRVIKVYGARLNWLFG
ncbi:hypothetical protein [Rheinheimera salexigens]|nr:hypothetical protein [Rheinheimera salexigens]